MESQDKTRVYRRQGIADFLRISRMTLNRWEKILPLPNHHLGCHIYWIEKSEVKAWVHRLRKEATLRKCYIRI